MDLIGWYAIVPLAVASLVTGVTMALATRWGLFRHYWIIVSLILTVIAVAVLLLHMPDVTATTNLARTADSPIGNGPRSADAGAIKRTRPLL